MTRVSPSKSKEMLSLKPAKKSSLDGHALVLVVFSIIAIQLASSGVLASAEVVVLVKGRTLDCSWETLSEVTVDAYDASTNGLAA